MVTRAPPLPASAPRRSPGHDRDIRGSNGRITAGRDRGGEPKTEAKQGVVLIPLGKIRAPEVVVQVEVDTIAHVGLTVPEVEEAGSSGRNEGRIERLHRHAVRAVVSGQAATDRMQTPV